MEFAVGRVGGYPLTWFYIPFKHKSSLEEPSCKCQRTNIITNSWRKHHCQSPLRLESPCLTSVGRSRSWLLAQAVRGPVCLCLGGRLAMTLVATISKLIFSHFPHPISLLSTFLIEGLLGSKTYLAKVDESESAQKSRGRHLTKHCRQFGPPCGHFGFCSRCSIVGSGWVPRHCYAKG